MLGQILEIAVGAGLQAARIKHLRDTFTDPAVVIAKSQGWVSPGRLTSQLGLTRKDAQIVLFGARQRGLLYQAVNGRFYPTPSPEAKPAPVITTPFSLEKLEERAREPLKSQMRGGSSFGKAVLVLVALGVGTIVVIAIVRRPEPSVRVIPTANIPFPNEVPAPVPAVLPAVAPVPSVSPQQVTPPPTPLPTKVHHPKHVKHKAADQPLNLH